MKGCLNAMATIGARMSEVVDIAVALASYQRSAAPRTRAAAGCSLFDVLNVKKDAVAQPERQLQNLTWYRTHVRSLTSN